MPERHAFEPLSEREIDEMDIQRDAADKIQGLLALHREGVTDDRTALRQICVEYWLNQSVYSDNTRFYLRDVFMNFADEMGIDSDEASAIDQAVIDDLS